eukprot:g5213.t1
MFHTIQIGEVLRRKDSNQYITVSFRPNTSGRHAISLQLVYSSLSSALLDYPIKHAKDHFPPFVGNDSPVQVFMVTITPSQIASQESLIASSTECEENGFWSIPNIDIATVKLTTKTSPDIETPFLRCNHGFYNGNGEEKSCDTVQGTSSKMVENKYSILPRFSKWNAQQACKNVYNRRRNVTEARACFRQRPMLLIGDSVSQQVASFLQCALEKREEGKDIGLNPCSGDNIHLSEMLQYMQLKKAMPDALEDFKTLLDEGSKILDKWYEAESLVKPVLVISPPGLWQAAYGTLSAWKGSLRKMLLSTSMFQKRNSLSTSDIFFVATTEVHPIHFINRVGVDIEWENKAWMTSPRIEVLNRELKELVLKTEFRYIDFWSPTRVRVDDPATPTDMRHYGASTVEQLTQILLSSVCL